MGNLVGVITLYEIAANVVSKQVTCFKIEYLPIPSAMQQNIKACKFKENIRNLKSRIFTIFDAIGIIIGNFRKALWPLESIEMFATFTMSYREIALETVTGALSDFMGTIQDMRNQLENGENKISLDPHLNWNNRGLEQLGFGLENIISHLSRLRGTLEEEFEYLKKLYQIEWIFLRQILKGEAVEQFWERNEHTEFDQIQTWGSIHRKLTNFIECWNYELQCCSKLFVD